MIKREYTCPISATVRAIRSSLGALIDIAQRLGCDDRLTAGEIHSLQSWIQQSEPLSKLFPIDVIHTEIKKLLQKGAVAVDRQPYLVKKLRDLSTARERHLKSRALATEIPYDSSKRIDFPQKRFCLTGDFIYAPRRRCEAEIRNRGGLMSRSLSKQVDYLVIGGLGSIEWNPRSLGTKIDLAMYYRKIKVPILVIKESALREALEPLRLTPSEGPETVGLR